MRLTTVPKTKRGICRVFVSLSVDIQITKFHAVKNNIALRHAVRIGIVDRLEASAFDMRLDKMTAPSCQHPAL